MAILVAAFFLIAKTKISFAPFQIQMVSWKTAVGVYLVLLGICFINTDYYNKGLKEGSDQVFKLIKMFKQQNENSHE